MLPLLDKKSPINIVIACRRRSSCRAIRALLSTDRELEIIAETSTGQGAISIAEQFHPDIVLLDVHVPVVNAIRASKRIKRHCPNAGVLLLTINGKTPEGVETADADGYLDAGANPNEIIAAIRNIARGRSSRYRRDTQSVQGIQP